MDLIKSLITIKNNEQPPFGDYLKELIKYEKLSRSPKFKHIQESKLLQKQLPLCWKAFQNEPIDYYLLKSCAVIIQNTINKELTIVDDLNNFYSNRKRKQFMIVGEQNGSKFIYLDISDAPSRILNKDENVLVLSEPEEHGYRVSIIDIANDFTNNHVYTGEIITDKKDERYKHKDVKIEPYHLNVSDDYVLIKTYSVQGNNDYQFAEMRNSHVSMPDSSHFAYHFKHSDNVVIKEINEEDIQKISLNKESLSTIANLILKYKPKII